MIRLLIFLMASLLAGGTGLAEDTSPCSVDTVPIQIVRGAKYDDVTTLSDAKIYNFPPGFISFVRDVTEHLVAKADQEKLCLDSADSKKRSLLQFVSWPITSKSHPLPSVPPLSGQSSSVCRISSPWVDIIIEQKPIPWAQGVFRYNERQLLADQAVLAGVLNVPLGVAMPMMPDEFNRYADLEYAPSEIRLKPAKKPIEERVPSDLLWLFRRAGHDPVYPFSDLAGGSMRKAMEMSSEGYTKIVIRLIDRCFESEGKDMHYNSILDLDDPILLEQYKIVTPIIVIPDH